MQKIITISITAIFAILFFLVTTTDTFKSTAEIERRTATEKKEQAEKEKRSKEYNMLSLVRSAVMAKLKDPSSADFSDVYLSASGTVCGRVNSKNSFGAYTGFFRFVSGGAPGATFIENESQAAMNFGAVWDQMCKI